MTPFDLLLIVLVLATAAALAATIMALALRRWKGALQLGAGVVLAWILYLGVGAVVAVSTPQRTMAIGQDRCFDEMCYAVTGFRRSATIDAPDKVIQAQGVFLIVNVRVSNRSKGHAQRERGRTGVLLDPSGRVYEQSAQSTQALALSDGPPSGLDAMVEPGQPLAVTLVFDVPANAHPAFALASNLAINPARIVIGDEQHLFHKPTIVPLD
jgi:hypothetical protein